MAGFGRMERRSKKKVDCVQGDKIWNVWGGWREGVKRRLTVCRATRYGRIGEDGEKE